MLCYRKLLTEFLKLFSASVCVDNVFKLCMKLVRILKLKRFFCKYLISVFWHIGVDRTNLLYMDCGVKCGVKVMTLIYYYLLCFVSVVKVLFFDTFKEVIESYPHSMPLFFSPLKSMTSTFSSF